ncbi:hypothetical protein [Embleya sp. NPDC020886]|uniref:hypothetical protein n=1 Tax=Embleya sp. NPDC020886 TaxID=3363980 RepID=UPI00378E80DB
MHRTLLAVPVLAATLVAAAPASAAPESSPVPVAGRWEPAPPTPPFDYPAGARCDFPVHAEPVLDEVVQQVLESNPDGSHKWVAYKGPLIVRVTNTATGASLDVDAGGSAVVRTRPDGSQSWFVLGPVLTTFRENGGTLPRGLYRIDGAYTLDIDANRDKQLTMLHGTAENLCPRLDRAAGAS